MNHKKLEQYSFWWSEVRLLVAAVALLIGGIPPIFMVMPYSMLALTALGLKLAWLISGVAAGYLLYRWYLGGQKVFGHKNAKDTALFLVLVVSGLNLGITGLIGNNIGMSLTSSTIVYVLVAVLYVYAAWHLWTQSKKHGGKLF